MWGGLGQSWGIESLILLLGEARLGCNRLIYSQVLRELWPNICCSLLGLGLVRVRVDPPLVHTTAIIILIFLDAPLFPLVKAVQRNI